MTAIASNNSVKQYMDTISHLLEIGSEFLLERLGAGFIEIQKGSRDFALDTDVELEKIYKEHLLKVYPDIPIMGEELSPDAILTDYTGLFWAIDPIDGTVNYARNIPVYGSSIALIQNGKPIAVGVGFPSLNETYIAGVGMGAFLNGERIYVSDTLTLDASMAAYGDFSVGENHKVKNIVRYRYVEEFGDDVLRIRMFGSAALQLAWVACGRVDISITLSNNAWDVQGGVLLVREAGGQVFDVDGSEHTILSKYTFATNRHMKNEVLKIVADIESSLK